ncbi:uncharacterized protein K452DRAFT_21 [Aplosporella prunicola CBS 121167]|uniref:Uncharacterized protein n=1 Tax=Aplosporella prunicola CBS 121167 TaxID=1176127 RepID=A0A6A6BUH5_9PEZI|nr:uncharacterized protein K452DRAFT_21 [Aplosporella prunicola CBS 121167]KAF2146993.1 hypothetical protein K452DRAFT_21 [Aplosporella prunicola CBS 121167]
MITRSLPESRSSTDSARSHLPEDELSQYLIHQDTTGSPTPTEERTQASSEESTLGRGHLLSLFQEGNMTLERGSPTSVDLDEDSFRQQPNAPTFLAIWSWELCSIIFSIICTIAIIALLPILNNKPLARWPFAILPNTIISTFITAIKASMLFVVAECISQLKWAHFGFTKGRPINDLERFDRASRGPWGSTLFLGSVRGHALLACIGALITIAALAMEPFGQLLLTFETRYILRENEVATIPVAYAYSNFYPDTGGTTVKMGYNRGMKGSLTNSLFGSSTALPFTCPSGVCKWPTFTSLGLWSSCANVTSSTARTCSMQFPVENSSASSLPTENCTAIVDAKGTLKSNCTTWPPIPLNKTRGVHVNYAYTTPNNIPIRSYREYDWEPIKFSSGELRVQFHETMFQLGAWAVANATSLPTDSMETKNISDLSFAAAFPSTAIMDDFERLQNTPQPLDESICRQYFKEIIECQF